MKWIRQINFQEIKKFRKEIQNIQEDTWCKYCGVVESLVPREVEPNFQTTIVSSPFLFRVAVQSLVVDHVSVVVPVVEFNQLRKCLAGVGSSTNF